MSKVVVAASSVQIVDSVPGLLGVSFSCDGQGPYCFINLERADRPDPDDVRFAPDEVTLDLDLSPLANMDCAPGVVRAIKVSPGRVILNLRKNADPDLGDLRMVEIVFDETPSQAEQLRLALHLVFEGTSVVPEIVE